MTTDIDAKLIEQGRKLFAGDWQFFWASPSIETLPPMAGIDRDSSSAFVAAEEADDFLVQVDDAITPPTVWLARFGEAPEPLKAAPARFDAQGLAITQHHAAALPSGARAPRRSGRATRSAA